MYRYTLQILKGKISIQEATNITILFLLLQNGCYFYFLSLSSYLYMK